MAATRLSMRKIRETLRLKWAQGLSHRQAARSCGIGRGTVSDYVLRARSAGLTCWKQVEGLSDVDLERRLFPSSLRVAGRRARPLPDWAEVHQELKRKSVTLSLLWEEYKSVQPEGYEYSRFCELYGEWSGRLAVCLRQEHKAGEKLFVDYSGQTVDVVNPSTGEAREAQVFVAVLGASSYAYAEATWTQDLQDWTDSHRRAFEFFDGVTELVIPDNLKSGVLKPCRYEPDINPTYNDLAQHYGTAVLPARVRKPRDKAKVEAGVLLVERWILACLRNRTFFSLAELNAEIRRLLDKLNSRPMQVLKLSRRELYERLDRPALKPLPAQAYVYGEWSKARVSIDYHVEIERHYYSVPYQLVKKQLDVRVRSHSVECFHKGQRVAVHVRSWFAGRHTTVREHMPKAHQAYLEWTPQRLIQWARQTGPATAGVVDAIMSSRAHPQQGFRPCLGLLRLGKTYSPLRLEAACRRALALGSTSYKTVKSILEKHLEHQPLPAKRPHTPPLDHGNIRGADYYAETHTGDAPC